MKTLLLFLFVGAVVVSQTEATCARCATDHPQTHYCQSEFAVRVEVIESNTDLTLYEKVTRALVIDAMKLGKRKTGKEITIYSPSSICGTYFEAGRQYVITGSKRERDGSRYLYHDSCDFAMDWDDLSPQQQKGFTKKYARYCDCPIESSSSPTNIKVGELSFRNTYKDARTYWTPTKCYYNPHKSRQFDKVEDCEEQYGYCAKGKGGKCSWQLAPDYTECFEYRDALVFADSGAFAITDPEQCNVLPKRKRKKCRQEAREYQESTGGSEIEIPAY